MTCMMYILQIGICFCFLVSSNALGFCKEKCEHVTAITLNASLKSEVFLPCYFNISHGNNTVNKAESVRWIHFSSLLMITQDGNIIFDNPRGGRVTVFPILAAGGNFSIRIHDLQPSDLGTYCCELNRECWTVEITEPARPDNKKDELSPWIYFAAGAGLFILLFIAFYLFLRFCNEYCENCITRSSKSNAVNGVQREGNHPEATQNAESSEHRNKNNRGRRRGNSTVYENDVHAPNQITGVQQRQSPQRAFRTVPEPTTSQQSNLKPYYVNQAELSIPNNAGHKRKKQKQFHIKNPIYGDGT